MNYKYRSFKVLMIAISVISAIVSLIVPIIVSVWNIKGTSIVGKKLIIIGVVIITGFLLDVVLVYFREKFARDYNKHNLKSLLETYFNLKYDYILDNGPSNILERCQDVVNETYYYMTGSSIEVWSAVIIIVASIILMGINNIAISMIMVCIIPINYLGYKMLNKELSKRSHELQINSAKGFQTILSYIGNVDYIKQCASFKEISKQLDCAEELLYGSMERINTFAQCSSRGIYAINNIAQIFSMLLIIYQITTNSMSSLSYVLYFTLFPIYFQKISSITKINLDKQKLIVAQNYVEELKANLEPREEVELENIESISFDVNKLNIKENDIVVNIHGMYKKGSVVRIQGKSGAGKSTLAKMLLKFRRCEGIQVNNIELQKINTNSLRKKVYYLSQNVTIINDTLRNNLFLNKKWNQEDEDKLLQMSILQPVLKRISLESIILEGGANLSGGEKQRIAIARAMLEKPEVAIYDEITSNLDNYSVKNIWKDILKDHEDKIIFIISHDNTIDEYLTDNLVIS